MEKLDYFCKGLNIISTLIVVSLLTLMVYCDFAEIIFLFNAIALIAVINLHLEGFRNYRVQVWHCGCAITMFTIIVSATIYYIH